MNPKQWIYVLNMAVNDTIWVILISLYINPEIKKKMCIKE